MSGTFLEEDGSLREKSTDLYGKSQTYQKKSAGSYQETRLTENVNKSYQKVNLLGSRG